MEERQAQLLKLVIEQYIALADPIGSKFLVDKGGLNWSEATVRNDLRALEDEGYLTHPHTSAGRIPTAKGYRYYLDHLVDGTVAAPKNLSKKLELAGSAAEPEIRSKQVAKTLVELAEEAVLVAFSPDRVYYTGLSVLFQKPDFADMGLVANVSAVFDRCEDRLDDFFLAVPNTPRCFIGAEHGFGDMLSIVAVRFGKHDESLMALVGPQRMDYVFNCQLLKTARNFIV